VLGRGAPSGAEFELLTGYELSCVALDGGPSQAHAPTFVLEHDFVGFRVKLARGWGRGDVVLNPT